MRLFKKTIKAKDVISFNEAKKRCIIDVRSSLEYKRGHVVGSRNIPLEKLVKQPQNYLKPDSEYYIICQSGIRSRSCVSALKRQGFTNVKNIKGGYQTYAKLQDNQY